MNGDPSSSICVAEPRSGSEGGGATLPAGAPGDLPGIDIRIDDDGWLADLPCLEALTRETIREVLGCCGAGAAEVSVLYTDDNFMAGLNRQYRGKSGTTNVLSFPADAPDTGEELMLGDIVLASGRVREEAQGQGKSLEHHVMHLLVHGTLHLLGHDHETGPEAAAMEALEVSVLGGLGVADPYDADRKPAVEA